MSESFPRQYARTQRFTLGEPRDVTVSTDGRRVVFLRSRAGDDPVNCLWVADAHTGEERLVADPAVLAGNDGRDDDAEDLPDEERVRRERLRESAGGITAYATDDAGTVTAFALGGRLYVAGLLSGAARRLDVAGPVFDPRPDPPARRVAYVSGRLLCLAELDGSWRVLAGGDLDEPDTVSWGSADFIAAEEMHRFRGYWWSPDGDTIAVCRVDTAPIDTWYISNPADPSLVPTEVRYPAAGTANAEVSLHLFPIDGSEPVDVEWDRAASPYLADVRWTSAGLVIAVQSRDQHHTEVLEVDVATGATSALFTDHDDAWVELVPGAPRYVATPDGVRTLVTCADRDGARRLMIDGEPVTPTDVQVRSVIAADAHDGSARVVFTANPIDEPTVAHVWTWTPTDGATATTESPGVHGAAVGGPTTVLRVADLDEPGARWTLPGGATLRSDAERPIVTPNLTMLRTDSGMPVAVLLPHDHDGSPLPVLVDPYGGPHAQRVVRSHNAFLNSQWFADQGFAVVIADGRGTPGRGSTHERALHLDLASAPLDDQVEAVQHAAAETGALDLDRVGIRGWSFGGYLAALAVMRRPDVFHAAVAGAPVTEWRLYDTHYTERYLGDPGTDAATYDASSLLPMADCLTRPLLLIHGLADDNVVAAHSLQLSSALLAAGRPHEVVAENLLLHQLDFLRRALGLTTVASGEDA